MRTTREVRENEENAVLMCELMKCWLIKATVEMPIEMADGESRRVSE